MGGRVPCCVIDQTYAHDRFGAMRERLNSATGKIGTIGLGHVGDVLTGLSNAH
jgi:hypothetical protein